MKIPKQLYTCAEGEVSTMRNDQAAEYLEYARRRGGCLSRTYARTMHVRTCICEDWKLAYIMQHNCFTIYNIFVNQIYDG